MTHRLFCFGARLKWGPVLRLGVAPSFRQWLSAAQGYVDWLRRCSRGKKGPQNSSFHLGTLQNHPKKVVIKQATRPGTFAEVPFSPSRALAGNRLSVGKGREPRVREMRLGVCQVGCLKMMKSPLDLSNCGANLKPRR